MGQGEFNDEKSVGLPDPRTRPARSGEHVHQRRERSLVDSERIRMGCQRHPARRYGLPHLLRVRRRWVPRWYSASDVRLVATSGGTLTFQGALYETHGILYGGASQYREVGNVIIAFTSLNAATMTYSVNGVLVSKQLQRYTFRLN